MAITARHVLGEKEGGEFHKDIRLSVFEQGSNGALGESVIESIFFQEKHDIAVFRLHPPSDELVRPEAVRFLRSPGDGVSEDSDIRLHTRLVVAGYEARGL